MIVSMNVEMGTKLKQDLLAKGADLERSQKILELVRIAESASTDKNEEKLQIPSFEDARIHDLSGKNHLVLDKKIAEKRFEALEIPIKPESIAEEQGAKLVFDDAALNKTGIYLYPKLAYGILNGGSATSYADKKKNQSLSPEAYSMFEREFESLADGIKELPKGISSAFINLDGSQGPSFILLKMRSLLLHALKYRNLANDALTPILPFFQMTSRATDKALQDAYSHYRENPLLRDLIEQSNYDPTKPLSKIQSLIAALTHKNSGKPRQFFDQAFGKPDSGLALPGGHGENFRVLASVYRDLYKQGVRYAYLGNVDNSGYTIDPCELAVFALQGYDDSCERQELEAASRYNGAFEFSWKTAMDIKGGILVEKENGRLSVADIGQAISAKEVAEQEKKNGKALFNCASGLFNLDYLIPQLDYISETLPIRVSEQEKDAGLYAQAEQTTWEVLGLMEKPLIFAVKKERRFLAAKLLLETFLSSPIGSTVETNPDIAPELKNSSALLRSGFSSLLMSEYGFSTETHEGHRDPLPLEELRLL